MRIVPSFNSGKDRQARLGVRLPDPAVSEFALQRRKEALRHGVVFKLPTVRMLGRTPISLQRLPNAIGALGAFNRSSQHWVVDRILDIHLRPRLVSSSRVFSGPGVQRIGDGVDLPGAPSGQVGTLGEVLP